MQLLRKPGAIAAAIALIGASPLANAVCPLDGATPFTAGPAHPVNGFPSYVQDSNGLALQICLAGDGTATGPANVCFFDAPIVGVPFSETIGFGPEAFYWLAQGQVDYAAGLPNGARRTVVTLAAEAAFVTPFPEAGQQFPFTRLRVVGDAPEAGVYTVTHPFGVNTYVVTAPGVRALRDVIDIAFAPDTVSQGRVGPWLRWDASLPAAPAGFIGDAQSAHPVVGSPCGTNFVRISAVRNDGTPIDLNGAAAGSAAETNLFTVAGQIYTALTVAPLSITGAAYSRSAAGEIRLNVFASAPLEASVSATPGGVMVTDGSGRFFNSSVQAAVPATVSVTALNPGNANATQVAPVKDVVTITRAEAACTGTGTARSCTLTIEANSSDQLVPTPLLSATGLGALSAAGTLSVGPLPVAPASVTVTSAAGGIDTEPVKVINQ